MGVCEGAVAGGDLRAETVVGDEDEEVEGGEVGDLGGGDYVFAADYEAAAVED